MNRRLLILPFLSSLPASRCHHLQHTLISSVSFRDDASWTLACRDQIRRAHSCHTIPGVVARPSRSYHSPSRVTPLLRRVNPRVANSQPTCHSRVGLSNNHVSPLVCCEGHTHSNSHGGWKTGQTLGDTVVWCVQLGKWDVVAGHVVDGV